MAEIREAVTDEEVAATYPVMSQLRTHLVEGEYPEKVRRMKEAGYRIAAVVEDSVVWAVAGFRVQEFMAYGKFLYVDDLVTAEEGRSLGYGKLLLDWLCGEAIRQGCVQLHLDSGVHRAGAHGFYFREGMSITSFHFAKTLEGR